MDTETKQIINDKINSLPEEIKQAISSAEVGSKVSAIAKKHQLLLDQADSLYLEVSLAMIGLEPLSDFVGNLVKNAGITKEKAELIVSDVNKDVFYPIRESLQKLNGVAEEKITEVSQNDRAQILDEIENPTPTSKLPVVESPEEVAITMMRQKMTKPTSSPMQHVVIKETPPITQQPKVDKPKGYVADPYRETI